MLVTILGVPNLERFELLSFPWSECDHGAGSEFPTEGMSGMGHAMVLYSVKLFGMHDVETADLMHVFSPLDVDCRRGFV